LTVRRTVHTAKKFEKDAALALRRDKDTVKLRAVISFW
jgi:hypothetical protein